MDRTLIDLNKPVETIRERIERIISEMTFPENVTVRYLKEDYRGFVHIQASMPIVPLHGSFGTDLKSTADFNFGSEVEDFQLAKTIHWCVQAMIVHEMNEQVTFQGLPVVQPHPENYTLPPLRKNKVKRSRRGSKARGNTV